jgi:hypothetical protein
MTIFERDNPKKLMKTEEISTDKKFNQNVVPTFTKVDLIADFGK